MRTCLSLNAQREEIERGRALARRYISAFACVVESDPRQSPLTMVVSGVIPLLAPASIVQASRSSLCLVCSRHSSLGIALACFPCLQFVPEEGRGSWKFLLGSGFPDSGKLKLCTSSLIASSSSGSPDSFSRRRLARSFSGVYHSVSILPVVR